MEVGEQEDCGRAVEVICREDGWDASADATHCAVPMDFAASRVQISPDSSKMPSSWLGETDCSASRFSEIEPLATSIIVWLWR